MKLFKVAAFSLAVAAMASSVQSRDFAEIYKECGLGGMLFPKDPIIAVITNVTWDLGTTAVTSQMSSPDSCSGGDVTMASFIMDAHPQLEQELAVGEGEYLASMIGFMGCTGREFEATAALRSSFSDVAIEGYYSASDFGKSEVLFNAAMMTATETCNG